MKSPLVSIQIPTYNQKEYIKQALDSALAQTYDNLQIIVSDDCSTDYDIFEYLKDYLNHLKVQIFRHPNNLGRVANYRYCLYHLVKGEWFINLDGDDYFINTNFIQKAVDRIILVENVAVFQANSLIDKISKNKMPAKMIDNETYFMEGIHYLNYLNDGLGFNHGNIIFNTSLAKKYNFYNHDILDSDYLSFLKILNEGNIVFWRPKVYIWRHHNNQATHTLDFNKVKIKYEAYEEIFKIYKGRSVYSFVKNNISYNLFSQLCQTLRQGHIGLEEILFLLSKLKLEKIYIKTIGYTIKKKIIK